MSSYNPDWDEDPRGEYAKYEQVLYDAIENHDEEATRKSIAKFDELRKKDKDAQLFIEFLICYCVSFSSWECMQNASDRLFFYKIMREFKEFNKSILEKSGFDLDDMYMRLGNFNKENEYELAALFIKDNPQFVGLLKVFHCLARPR